MHSSKQVNLHTSTFLTWVVIFLIKSQIPWDSISLNFQTSHNSTCRHFTKDRIYWDLENKRRNVIWTVSNDILVESRNTIDGRIILADPQEGCRSEVFRAMFKHSFEEKLSGIIKLQNMNVSALRAFLKFIYSWELDANDMKVTTPTVNDAHHLLSFLIQPLQTIFLKAIDRSPRDCSTSMHYPEAFSISYGKQIISKARGTKISDIYEILSLMNRVDLSHSEYVLATHHIW